ncbi:hypothetical protein TcWFU_008263 [Taenia crassiceps]|uniref:Uncharacterized protein n=1 Tax=Taenia crassiceps TaxID=6207 RepID=A0ABR4Q8F8_9CEST
MNSFEVNPRVAADAKADPGRESSNFANRLKFMKRIRKPDKRRANTMSVHSDVSTDSLPKESSLSSDIVTVKLTGSQEKFTKSLTDENDTLRNKNTMLRYQVELLSEQLNDLRDVNMDLRNQNSRIREENSVLRNEQTQLSARNDCLVEQIIVLQKMLEDMGVSSMQQKHQVTMAPHAMEIPEPPPLTASRPSTVIRTLIFCKGKFLKVIQFHSPVNSISCNSMMHS